MTKQNFIALADIIIASRKENPSTWRQGEIRELAEFCRSQNPVFNPQQWFDYIDGKCGKNGGKLKP